MRQFLFPLAAFALILSCSKITHLQHPTTKPNDQLGAEAITFDLVPGQNFQLRYVTHENYRSSFPKIIISGNSLIRASLEGTTETVRCILKEGVSSNYQNKQGNTALMAAVLAQRIENIKVLLLHGANPNAVNHKGDSAMQLAEGLGNQEIIDILKTPKQYLQNIMSIQDERRFIAAANIIAQSSKLKNVKAKQDRKEKDMGTSIITFWPIEFYFIKRKQQ